MRRGIWAAAALAVALAGCAGEDEAAGAEYIESIRPAFVRAEQAFGDSVLPCLQPDYEACAQTGAVAREAIAALVPRLEEATPPAEAREAHDALVTSFREFVDALDDQAAAIAADDDDAFGETIDRIRGLVAAIDDATAEIELAIPGTDLPSMH